MANGALQGWHADPFGLHEMRYISAGRPTKLVRDGRMEVYDEPPVEEAASGTSAGAAFQGGPGLVDATRVASSEAGPPELWAPGTGGRSPGAEVGGLNSSGTAAPARRKRRRLEYAAVAAGAVVAVLVFVALAGGSGSPGIAPAAFVTTAAQQTLAQSTADVTLSGMVHVDGEDLAFGGNGQVDFRTNVMSLDIGASIPNGSMTETELLVGGNLYLQVTADGHNLAAVTGGRHWIEIPFAQLGSQTVTNGSPGTSLSLLRQNGASVTPLGTRNIDGQTCSGYAVTPSKQGMLAGAQAEWAQMGLSEAQTSAARQALQSAPLPKITAWFDAQRKLACQVTINLQIGDPTAAGAADAQMVMAFTHYGVPVTVSAPAASDTVSIQQLVTAASH